MFSHTVPFKRCSCRSRAAGQTHEQRSACADKAALLNEQDPRRTVRSSGAMSARTCLLDLHAGPALDAIAGERSGARLARIAAPLIHVLLSCGCSEALNTLEKLAHELHKLTMVRSVPTRTHAEALGCDGTRKAARLAHPMLRAAVDRCLRRVCVYVGGQDSTKGIPLNSIGLLAARFPSASDIILRSIAYDRAIGSSGPSPGPDTSIGCVRALLKALRGLPPSAWLAVKRVTLVGTWQLLGSVVQQMVRTCPSLEQITGVDRATGNNVLPLLSPMADRLQVLHAWEAPLPAPDYLRLLSSFRRLQTLGIALDATPAAVTMLECALHGLTELTYLRLRPRKPTHVNGADGGAAQARPSLNLGACCRSLRSLGLCTVGESIPGPRGPRWCITWPLDLGGDTPMAIT